MADGRGRGKAALGLVDRKERERERREELGRVMNLQASPPVTHFL